MRTCRDGVEEGFDKDREVTGSSDVSHDGLRREVDTGFHVFKHCRPLHV